MILDMKPKQVERLHNVEVFCLEDSIATLCNWLNRDYELMFLYSWDFNYRHTFRKASTIEDITGFIFPVKRRKVDLLHKYHGIRLNWNQYSSRADNHSLIISELNANRPVIVVFDSYWCPWENGYKNNKTMYRYNHVFIITGFDYKTNNYYCVDGYYNSNNLQISADFFWNGFLGCHTVQVEKCEKYGLEHVLHDIKENLCGDKNQESAFDAIREYSKDLRNADIQTGQVDMDHLQYTSIWAKISLIEKGRLEFAVAAKFLAKKYPEREYKFLEISRKLLKCAEKWETIKRLAGKLLCGSLSSTALKERISDKILDVAADEEQIAVNMLFAAAL